MKIISILCLCISLPMYGMVIYSPLSAPCEHISTCIQMPADITNEQFENMCVYDERVHCSWLSAAHVLDLYHCVLLSDLYPLKLLPQLRQLILPKSFKYRDLGLLDVIVNGIFKDCENLRSIKIGSRVIYRDGVSHVS